MIWLLLCAISYIGIFLLFKLLDIKKVPLINAVVINYIAATICGFVLNGSLPFTKIISSDWLWMGIIIGILFIVMFLVIGISTKKTGIGITSVASKMSLVIPMTFSIVAFKEPITILKITAILLAIISVFMCTYKRGETNLKIDASKIILPIILFIGMGIVDSLVIFSKESYQIKSDATLFTATLFGFSFISGLIYSLTQKKIFSQFLNPKTWIYGIILGLFNFGSIYFVIMSMNAGIFSNSLIYGICNTATVLVSIVLGTMFFKEKLTKLNILGGVFALITIAIMALS